MMHGGPVIVHRVPLFTTSSMQHARTHALVFFGGVAGVGAPCGHVHPPWLRGMQTVPVCGGDVRVRTMPDTHVGSGGVATGAASPRALASSPAYAQFVPARTHPDDFPNGTACSETAGHGTIESLGGTLPTWRPTAAAAAPASLARTAPARSSQSLKPRMIL